MEDMVRCGLAVFLFAAITVRAQGPRNVLVVVNRQSADSQKIGEYYVNRRAIPANHICRLSVTADEEISREIYTRDVEEPVAECLTSRKLVEQVLYIVTTLGVPLKIAGAGNPQGTTAAAVDSELATLYLKIKGKTLSLSGPLTNPLFGKTGAPFRHPDFPIYLVTRLAGYDYEDVVHMIDHALEAVDRGKVVIDVRADENTPGNQWLRAAAAQVPQDRLILDDSARVLYDQTDVIAYASWGFNDPDRHRRTLGFHWLPGAVMTEFVSTNGRTFRRPPPEWTLGNWKDSSKWFAGSPQDLCADEIHAGVTGASGHVYEPFLALTPRPEYLIPAYLEGRTLAESYYLAIPAISWQNIVLGDPLCRLRKAVTH
jgi:uncharacterized protein (TIGR03790 family)